MMQLQIDQLALRILSRAEQLDPSQRLLVGVAGIPGSGKSSLAYPLTDRLNQLLAQPQDSTHGNAAVCIGVDGWHYSQAELRDMANSEHLFARRGAHFTFNADSFRDFVTELSLPSSTTPIPFPTFSHTGKDPVFDPAQRVELSHRIVVIEGLYCFLDVGSWGEAGRLLHERIWVDLPKEIAYERLVRRHLQDGVESTREAATRRVEQSDLVNADFLIASIMPPTFIVSGHDHRGSELLKGTGFHSAVLPPFPVLPQAPAVV